MASEENEGFLLTEKAKAFSPPSNTASLDPATKRRVTICNLFANYKLPIHDIVRILDESYGTVVTVLIEEGLVLDRRRVPRSSLPSPNRSLFHRSARR